MLVGVGRNESWGILSDRNDDAQGMIRALGFVVLAQPLSQAMNFDPRNRILSGVEALGAFEHLYRDVVLLDLVGFAREKFGAEVLQQTSESW